MPNPDQRRIEIEVMVTDGHAGQLREALGLGENASIDEFLAAVATVSTEMFLRELLGQSDYPTKLAARQERIQKLVKHGFNDEMPAPSVIASLFHVTPSAAASVLASTVARYGPSLKSARTKAVASSLEGKLWVTKWAAEDPNNNEYSFRCTDAAVVSSIRAALAASEVAVAPLVKNREATNVYDIHASAISVVETEFNKTLAELVRPEDRDELLKQLAGREKQEAIEAAKRAKRDSRKLRGK